MPTSFIELVKEKFLSPLEKLSQDPSTSSEWWAVVMDDQARSIFNSCCEEHQIIKHNVTTIDRLNEERTITSQFGALYYIFPTEENIDRIIKDFQAAVPQSVSKSKGFRRSGVPSNAPYIANSKDCYKSAHLYFLEIVPDEVIVKIKSSPIYPYLKGLTEIYINYYPFESNVFNLRETDSFFKLFSMSTKTSKAELINLAQKLVTVCSSLNERPLVRFQSMRSGLDNPCILAYAFQNELDRFCQINNIPVKDPSERATLLILDRACDFYAPILHDFNYQGMINDLIHLADGITYRHEYVASSGKKLENFYTLDERDELWKELRHFHIAECNQKLTSKFHAMISENPAAKSMMKRRQNGEVAKLRDMRDIVTSVPELQQYQELYSLHFGLAETVMERFKTRQLEEVAMCEQNIATGTFPDGEALKNALNEMVPILNNPKVLLSDKLRLLLIYQIHMKGFANVDRRRLETHAGLTQSDKDAITNMEFLLNNRPTQPSDTDNITRFMSSLSFRGKKKEAQEEVPYDISRYQPALRKTLINLIDNQLDFDAFPQVGASESPNPNPNPPASPTKKPAASLRKSNKPAWELKSDDPTKPAPRQSPGGKIIVFIAGGASYSELRAACEVSKAKNREILIGSTDIVAPDDFVEALRLMRYQASAGNPTSPQNNLAVSPKPIGGRSPSPLKLAGDRLRRSNGGVLEPPSLHVPNHLKDHQHRSSMPNLSSDLEINKVQIEKRTHKSSSREPRKPLPTPGQYNTISVQRTASEQVPQAPRPQNPYKAATASKGGFFSKLFQ